MLERLLSPRLFVSALLLLCLVSEAQAARWYRVELMAFSQRGAELSEQWAPEPELNYPARARFLQDAASASRTEPAPSATLDEAAIKPATAAAFIKLPAQSREFEKQANSMARSGRYRVLFHEAWIQPVANKASALPLILERGDEKSDWPQLQGSVKLHLSRYLHLETNLWLNTQGDYLSGDWRMPAPPSPATAYFDGTTGQLLTRTEQGTQDSPETKADQTITGFEGYPSASLSPVYPYRHAVLLQQKRRMRSNEMHYIDHPMLGLVIKLTPLETGEG